MIPNCTYEVNKNKLNSVDQLFLLKLDAKILNAMLSNQIQDHVKINQHD